MKGERDDLTELRAALRADVQRVIDGLALGPRNKKASSKNEWRWGSHGSLALVIRGRKRGLWRSYEGGESGDLLDLIRHVRGINFSDALEWARDLTGLTVEKDDGAKPRRRRPEPPPVQPGRDEAAEAAEAAVRIAKARAIAAGSEPLRGTPGARYLKQHRGIPEPASGWPSSILWHPGHRAVLAVATDAAGTIQAVQRIHLGDDDGKLGPEEVERRKLPAAKVTNGVLDGAAVRLPGNPVGPLLLAEGPETGLSAWAVTGYETWICCGPVANARPPEGRRVVALSDDNPAADDPDAKKRAAERGLRERVQEWRLAGVDVAVATPWPVRRHDKTDFNDLVRVPDTGPDLVRERIALAVNAPSPPPSGHRLPAFYDPPVEPREQALARQKDLIRTAVIEGAISGGLRRKIAGLRDVAAAADPDFDQRPPAAKAALTRRITREVLAEHGMERLPDPRRLLVTGSQGSGKTTVALNTAAVLHAALASIGLPDEGVGWIAEPTLEKAAEAQADYLAVATSGSRPSMLIRGRSADDPSSVDGEKMCLRSKVATEAARKGVQVRKAICASCPHRPQPGQPGCGYLRQEAEIAAMGGRGVFFVAHAYLHLPCPAPSPDWVVGDEAITLGAVDEVLDESPDILVNPVPFEGGRLADIIAANRITTRLRDALTSPEPLAALRAHGPTRDEMLFAKELLQAAVDARQVANIDGGMSDEEIEDVLADVEANTAGKALVILSAVLRELDQPRRVLNGVVYHPARRVVVDGREEHHPRLRVHRLRPLRGITRDTTVVLPDGTGSAWMNRVLLQDPDLEHHRIAIERDAHVTSTRGKRYSRQSLTGEDRYGKPIENKAEDARRLRGELKQVADRLPGDTVVIATKKVAGKLREEGVTPAPENVAHFGSVRGRNTWERCASGLIVGAESVSVEAVEDRARAFMVDDPEPFVSFAGPVDKGWGYEQWPFRATRGRRMRDGSVQPIEVEVHPDPRVQEVLEQIREADVLQAGDRVRPIFNRRTLVFCNSLVLDLTYDRVVTHRELVAGGSRLERVFAELGVLPLGKRDLHHAYPAAKFRDGFRSPAAAEDCLKQQALRGGASQIESYLGNPPPYEYRRKGQPGSPGRALIDTRRHPVPRLALEALLGPLAGDPVLLAPEPPPEPPPPEPPPPAPPAPPPVGRGRPEPPRVGSVIAPGVGGAFAAGARAPRVPAMAARPRQPPCDDPGDWLVFGPVLRGGAVPAFDATWRGSGAD